MRAGLLVTRLNKLPYLNTFVGEADERTPLDVVAAEMRETTLDLYEDIPNILGGAKEQVARFEEIERLLDEIQKDSDNQEFYDQLHNLLNSEAEADLNLGTNSEADAFIEAVKSSDPLRQQKERKETTKQAYRFLRTHQPVMAVSKTMLVTTVEILDQQKRDYADVLAQKRAINAVHKNAGHLLRAEQLSVAGPSIINTELNLAIDAAQLVLEASKEAENYDQKTAPKKAADLKLRAEQLLGALEKNRLALSEPKNPAEENGV
jgi:hypothetical protein